MSWQLITQRYYIQSFKFEENAANKQKAFVNAYYGVKNTDKAHIYVAEEM